MSSCPECSAAATNPHWGGARAECRGCQVREIARAPKKRRQEAYVAYGLQCGDRAMVQQLIDEVTAESRRLAGLSRAPATPAPDQRTHDGQEAY